MISQDIRLSKIEREKWRASFSEWQTPQAMSAKVEELRRKPGTRLMYQSGLEFWREAHTAADFSHTRKASRVRLRKDIDRPDFEIEIDGKIKQFEVTEADRSSRRRGDEYRDLQGKRNTQDQETLEVREAIWLTPEVVSADLGRACEKKSGDLYSSDCGLVIQIMGFEFFDEVSDEIEAVMHRSTEFAGTMFDSVWVMSGASLRKLWQNGEMVPIIRLALDRSNWV